MLNFTLRNSSDVGKNCDRHPHILTYVISVSGSRFLTPVPSILAEKNNFQNGPCAFWQMPECNVFFPLSLSLSAEIRGFKVLSYIPLKELPICSGNHRETVLFSKARPCQMLLQPHNSQAPQHFTSLGHTGVSRPDHCLWFFFNLFIGNTCDT